MEEFQIILGYVQVLRELERFRAPFLGRKNGLKRASREIFAPGTSRPGTVHTPVFVVVENTLI